MTAGSVRLRPRVPRAAVTAADGLVLVDKPQGVTSHDVVGAARRLAGTRKVGHAGTLDPMATGLLVLGVGRATRFLTYLVGADKTYEATVRLGQETVTDDAEGEVTAGTGCHLEEAAAERLAAAMAPLTGQVMQVPSAVSAIRVDGVRSYQRVRSGQGTRLAARAVTVHELALRGQPHGATAPDGTAVVDADLYVACSSGTYVRALARDLGRALGCGAHLTALRRTSVGTFDLGEASTLEELSAQVEAGAAFARPQGLPVVPVEVAARRCLGAVELTEEQARALSYGQALPAGLLEGVRLPEPPAISAVAEEQRVVAGFAPDGTLVALLARRGARARPVLVLAPA